MPEKTRGVNVGAVMRPVLLAIGVPLAYPWAEVSSTEGPRLLSIESPVNPLPPVVILLSGIIFAVEGVLSLADARFLGGAQGIGWRLAVLQDYGFAPAIWEFVVERGQWTIDLVKRFVTYAFVHGSFTSALFAGAMFLALGKFVGEVFAAWAVIVVALGSAVVGAVVFALLAPGNPPLIGAYPMVYGMIGAFTYLTWLRLSALGENQMMAFRLIGFLLGLQLFFSMMSVVFPNSWGQVRYDWIADLAGFAFGLSVSPLVSPGGWAAFVRRVRAR